MTRTELKTYYIRTFGCQMNERDSETVAGIFRARGMTEAPDMASADIIMINTCAVREKAEQKVYGLLGTLRELKENNPDVVLGICGCMPQQQEVAKRIKTRFPYMDIIIGTHNLNALNYYLEQVLQERRQVLEIWQERAEKELELPARRSGKYKAFVNINWGCNNFCTYCIVPYVRGREKSRPPETIIREIEALAREGFVEVTLLGQNVNSYGKDLPGKPDFADLLRMVNDIPGIERIRFMTSHPRDAGDRLFEAMATLPKVCNHLHLPLQAGNNRILERMNRGYTAEHYLRIVEKLRAAVPDIALTTDLIVGFPGETEAEFQDTLAMVEKVRFDSAFTFMFSPRRGTPAAKMKGQLDSEIKKERLQRLIKLQNQISLERNQQLVGTVQQVLVEERTGTINKGRTTSNKLVFFASGRDLSGHLVPVRITNAKTWSLEGELGD
ncbi:MAG TPA: tRNA (N6-isopentenyl adenosine(37)-C2)-methylthiotransferase MiaB [Bacillota bacterium]|nr:tRNA (N6-isopentenyl adenosine(37)-C2)-methylthiotransferase MiaB [Bacillota bacterium]HPZ90051.1 tRNA (N6-isopentenyl adenosine(37)-C2)-methylthiotransferase MiaB [Bacillota bacterium]HQE00997.1 tRNA (N6-isopentenyl adenosine(37)-C2)-methylthiotransferase MiaB [Bacillota bacterium]